HRNNPLPACQGREGARRLSSPQGASTLDWRVCTMARTARPWFRGQIGWWCAYIDGRQVRLAKGRKNKGEANRKLQELLFGRGSNPAPGESAEPTVASIVETYLAYA